MPQCLYKPVGVFLSFFVVVVRPSRAFRDFYCRYFLCVGYSFSNEHRILLKLTIVLEHRHLMG